MDKTTNPTPGKTTVVDNGPKWGSTVGPPNKHGYFQYDRELHRTDPQKHFHMILERTSWINENVRRAGSNEPNPKDSSANWKYKH